MYKDYPEYIKKHGLNGYTASSQPENNKDDNDSGTSQKPQSPDTGGTKTVVYTVKSGDTLTSIAKKYGTTVDKIAKDNKIANPNIIYPGQKLKITTKSTSKPVTVTKYVTYTVKSGDTLSAIANKYGTTVSKIAKDNNISNPDLIYPGQKLKIAVKK